MTERPETIKNIIDGLTNYSGNYFSNVTGISKVNEALPKFFVKQIYNRNNNDNVQQSQFFRIELEADSQSNLTQQIKDILALQTNSTAGYNPATSILATTYEIVPYTDDSSLDKNDANRLTGDTNRITELAGTGYYTMMRFTSSKKIGQGAIINNAQLKITAKNTNADDSPIFYFRGWRGGSVGDPSTTNRITWESNETVQTLSEDDVTGWTAETEHIFTGDDIRSILLVVQEMVDNAGFDNEFGFILSLVNSADTFDFYAKDVGDSNPTKYPVLELNVYEITSDYPYWIKMDLIDDKPDANKFKALIECEARWTI